MRKLFLIPIILFLCGWGLFGTTSSNYTDYTQDPDCLLALCMMGNANDSSVSANSGTVVNATLTTGKWGYTNTAYLFDGTGDYITLPACTIGTRTTYSIIVTYKSTGTNEDILYAESDNDNDFSELAIGDGYCYWVTKVSGVNGPDLVEVSATVNDGNWHTLAMVKTNTTNMKLYIDGVEVDSETATAGATGAVSYASIGAIYWTSAYIHDVAATIGQVGIFVRPLTTTELTEIHQHGLRGNY